MVQKDAPNDLLLGTDLQPRLGFSLIMRKGDGVEVDVLGGDGKVLVETGAERTEVRAARTDQCQESARGDPHTAPLMADGHQMQPPVGEVHLLQPVKIPGRVVVRSVR